MKMSELRAKSKEELKDMVLSSKKELFNLRMQSATGQLEKQNRFKEVRRTIAQVKTLLNEKPGAAVKPAVKKEKAVAKKPAAKKAKKD
jgi:large subunit ribosomal protein L29